MSFQLCFKWLIRVVMALMIVSLIGCTPLSVTHPETAQQRAAVKTFYDKAVSLNVMGLPTAEELAQLKPLLSTRLVSLLEQAQAHQARDHARHRGAEPPLVQGSVFFSLFEGANRVIAVAPDDVPNLWAVTLGYGRPGIDEVSWTDEVLLTKESDRWVVDDLERMGQWDFSHTGWLSNTLMALQNDSNR